MASVRNILFYPDERLTTPTKPVAFPLSAEDFALVEDLTETMYSLKACGLGANQVGSDKSIFVLDLKAIGVKEAKTGVFINPSIVYESKQTDVQREQCLSLPAVFVNVRRPVAITICAQDLDGVEFSTQADKLFARAALHEYDHLQGRLILERCGTTWRRVLEKKLSAHV